MSEQSGRGAGSQPAGKPMDLRGAQTRIGRLLPFFFEGWLHMLFYRIMIPLTIVYGLFVAVYLVRAETGGAWAAALKASTAAVWLLWTPQFFEVFKGLALAWSRGMAFGHLNGEFAALYRKRYRKKSGGWTALPYVVLALWLAGLVILLVRWFP